MMTSKITTARKAVAITLAALFTIGASPAFAAGSSDLSLAEARLVRATKLAEKAELEDAAKTRKAVANRKAVRKAKAERKALRVGKALRAEKAKRNAKALRNAKAKRAEKLVRKAKIERKAIRKAKALRRAPEPARTTVRPMPRPNPKAKNPVSLRARISAENRKHARRVAKIARIMDLAANAKDRELITFGKKLMQKETARHERFMMKFSV